MTEKQAYIKKTREVVKRIGNLSERDVKEMLQLLEATREGVIAELSTLPDEAWKRSMIRGVVERIDRRIAQYKTQMTKGLTAQQEQMWAQASVDTHELLTEITGVKLITVNRDLLEATKDLTVALVSNVTQQAKDEIASAIRLGLLQKQSLNKIIKRVGNSLTSPSVFGTIANRAEVITRTETLRAYSMSADAHRMAFADKLMKDTGLTLYKKWDASNDSRTRDTHRKADGQIVKQTEKFRVGNDRLDYPRDPSGSPEETINCRCAVVPAGERLLDDIEKAQASPSEKTASMRQFEKETGKQAIWRDKITKNFEDWQKKSSQGKIDAIEEISKEEENALH